MGVKTGIIGGGSESIEGWGGVSDSIGDGGSAGIEGNKD